MSKILFAGSLVLLVIAVVQTAPVSSPSSTALEVVDTLSEIYGNRVKRQGGGCGCCGCGCCGCGGGGGGCGCCCCRPKCCCCCRRCCTCCRTCCCTRCCTCCRPCCCGCGCGCGGGGRKRRSLQNLRIKHAEKIGQESQEKSIEQVENVEKIEESKPVEESTLVKRNVQTPVGDIVDVPEWPNAYGYY